jgi:hypothetical protein
MGRRILLCLAVLVGALALGAVGANPRYLEELRIGGGYGEPVDGGADFVKNGDLLTDGNVTAGGDLAGGAFDASPHSATIQAGSGQSTYLNLNEANAQHGGAVWFDGATDKLHLGTRNGSSTPVKALEISKGNAGVTLLGNLTLNSTGSTQLVQTGVQLDLRQNASSGAALIDLTPAPADGTSSASFRMFRATNTTGSKKFTLYSGNNSTDLSHVFTVGSAPSYLVYNGVSSIKIALDGATGNGDFTGDGTFQGGDVVAGTDGGTRGVITAWDGSGGNAPGCIKLASPNGTVWYLFVEDDGTVKVSSALPTQNNDGTVVGSQF